MQEEDIAYNLANKKYNILRKRENDNYKLSQNYIDLYFQRAIVMI